MRCCGTRWTSSGRRSRSSRMTRAPPATPTGSRSCRTARPPTSRASASDAILDVMPSSTCVKSSSAAEKASDDDLPHRYSRPFMTSRIASEVHARLVPDDQAVGEEHDPVGVAAARGSCVTIDDRLAELVDRRAAAGRSPRRWSCESRLPVGSSAKMIAGRVSSARATATRCCWPPESSDGPVVQAVAEPDGVDQLLPPRLVDGAAGEAQRQLHVLLGREHRQQVEELEDEADACRGGSASARRREAS